MKIFIAVALMAMFSALFATNTQAAVYDIRSYGAVAGDANDDAAAFRAAYAAAAAAGGGTIYVPAGLFVFGSADPLDATSHVVIRHPGIRISGDARGGDEIADQGSIIRSNSATRAVFKVAQASLDDVPGGPYGFPNGLVLEHLHITRSAIEPLQSTAVGILFDNLEASQSPAVWIYRTQFDNIRVQKHYDGVRSSLVSATQYARPTTLRILNSGFANNISCGLFLNAVGGLRVVNSEFYSNGQDGCRIRSHSGFAVGTVQFVNTDFTENGFAGISIRGENGSFCQDIAFSNCQFDANGYQGMSLSNAKQIQIASCEISANGRSSTGPGEGMYFGDVQGATVSATTFIGNRTNGASIASSFGVSMSACTFNFNNQYTGTATQSYALVLTGGRQQTYSAMSFVGTQFQKHGVLLQFDPKGIVMTGLTFEDGMTQLLGQFSTTNAEFRVEYFAGTNYVVVED